MLLISVCTKRCNHPSTLLSECKKTPKNCNAHKRKKPVSMCILPRGIQGTVIPDVELSLLVIRLGRGHSQMVNGRPGAGLAVADGQESVFLSPGEQAEFQRVYFFSLTVLNRNSVLNIEEFSSMNKIFTSLKFS